MQRYTEFRIGVLFYLATSSGETDRVTRVKITKLPSG